MGLGSNEVVTVGGRRYLKFLMRNKKATGREQRDWPERSLKKLISPKSITPNW
jgi:hypothetical protein